MKNKTLLIISAHADDHISSAGTVFKLTREQGYTPYEIVLTNSNLGQNFKVNSEINQKDVALTRAKELSKASRFLGIKKTYCLNQQDLALTYSQNLVFEVVKVIREVKPSIVFLHNNYDAHPDHHASYLIGLNAIKVAAMGVQSETLGPSHRVPMVLCAEGMLPVKTQIHVDITPYLNDKVKLFKLYLSQANPKAVAFEKAQAVIRGYHLRKADGFYGEAFTLQEEFPVLFFEPGL